MTKLKYAMYFVLLTNQTEGLKYFESESEIMTIPRYRNIYFI